MLLELIVPFQLKAKVFRHIKENEKNRYKCILMNLHYLNIIKLVYIYKVIYCRIWRAKQFLFMYRVNQNNYVIVLCKSDNCGKYVFKVG